ncbi:hypothetical protein ABH930_006413 [Kitasatospora sp. GAS204A]|uniref:hypothetical protein n=1 Tax=unclassified Kitasatospora TaxID=2633591 RepID=UPI0024770F34|nr:hypothetical protein [Kitasatospora sp. GAS204B]MDH6121995.1 hypothetical protein [Kitasatospora sp. GAS204B]
MPSRTDHTHSAQFRIPRVMWEAYGRVAERLETDRTAMLLAHVRGDIQVHGDAADLEALKQAEQELAERRARRGGRPRRQDTDGPSVGGGKQ